MIVPRLITTAALLAATTVALNLADIPQSMTDDVAVRSQTENVADIIAEYVKALNLLPDDANILYRRQQASPSGTPDLSTADIPESILDDIASRSKNENMADILLEYVKSLDVLPDDANVMYRRRLSTSQATNSAAALDARHLEALSNNHPLLRRQSITPPAPVNWDASVMSACNTALTMLRGLPASQTGMAMCYNLPFLDNSTGVFEADLRLFTVGPATGAFAGVAAKNIAIDVLFAGAQVQPIPMSDLSPRPKVSARRLPVSWPPSRRSGLGNWFKKRAGQAPVLAQSYAFVGQINRELQNANLNSSALQAIITPAVTLSLASNPSTNSILTPLEATFVVGVFSGQPRTMATLSAGTVIANVAFVIPGTRILIFPIGGIITGVWAVFFVGAVGWGTVGRMRFRENYRRRLARAEKRGERRI